VDLDGVLETLHVAVVVPAYQAAGTIEQVLATVPAFVRTVVVVDDASTDDTARVVEAMARRDARVVLERHAANGGVGAAMKTGYRRASAAGAEIVAKMDADGQMDPANLARLVLPVALGTADYAKGNRFLRPKELRQMPVARLVGNAVLSFVSKLSSGYWQLLDPTNGYTAISREALDGLDLDQLDDRYFFESSMLIELGMVRAVAVDVPMPSRYGDEQSQLSVSHSAVSFTLKHTRYGLRRFGRRYFVTDFSPASLLLALAFPLAAFGVGFGLRAWIRGSMLDQPATAGQVMIAALSLGAGGYCFVQAMVYDMVSVPQRPLTPPRLLAVAPVRPAR
jgi:glycosyltransferase involved in cell wall biosynthesis